MDDVVLGAATRLVAALFFSLCVAFRLGYAHIIPAVLLMAALRFLAWSLW